MSTRAWLLVLLSLAPACGHGDDNELVVTIETGTVEGAASGDIRRFLGIPYAAPPKGPNRFRAPQPAEPWTDVRPAFELGQQCPQSLSLAGTSNEEDCLFVNVWTPSGAKNLPVMVWLHGGAFILGSGGDKYYDGGQLASHDVVVVSMNYRLGIFGFLAHPALRSDDPAFPTAGNYGIEDQRAALEWVQRNIATFGGDPRHVTLFGESAGGMSTCLHYLSSRTEGLFEAAISQSGLCSSPLLEIPRATAEQHAQTLAVTLGCAANDATTAACLRSRPVDQILMATPLPAATDPPGGPVYQASILPGQLPSIDGYVVERSMSEAFAAGQYAPRPLILGNVKDEGTLFHSLLFAQEVPDEAAYRAALATRFDATTVNEIVTAYPVSAYPNANRALAEVTGDAFFMCPSARTAREVLAHGSPLYRYTFDRALEQPFSQGLDVFHSSELPFVFGNDTFPLGRIGSATELSTTIQRYWTQFAKTQDPNVGGETEWPAYATSEPVLVLDTTVSTTTAPKATACAFWDARR